MKVTLRKNLNKNGDKWLWKLDTYPKARDARTGVERRFHSLSIFTYTNPKNAAERNYNDETTLLLENLRTEFFIKARNNKLEFIKRDKDDTDFLKFFRSIAEKKKSESSNYSKWLIVYKYLMEFSNTIQMSDLTIQFATKFQEYLLKRPHFRIKGRTISSNSAASYYSKFSYALKQAYKDNFIEKNIAYQVDPIRTEQVKKVFLTLDEIKRLYRTDCKDDLLKRVCLFMAYTGLRVSDAQKLRWDEIEFSQEVGHFIRFKHQKTGLQHTLPISDEAHAILTRNHDQLVFPKFRRDYKVLNSWANQAEVNKKIGFHTFRHTSATLMLNLGVDVFTVQKMLGHSDIKSTMIYVSLLDNKKIEAANKISLI